MIPNSSTNLKGLLANTALFEMLDDSQLDRVLRGAFALRLAQNQRVVHQGDRAEGAFWVIYGQVQVGLCSRQGGHKTLGILGKGHCFGLGEMLLEQTHQTFVDTTQDTLLVHAERSVMLAAARENFDFARYLMTCIGRQVVGLVRDIGGYAQSARQRLAAYLLRQVERQGGLSIRLVASKTLIASRLGLTPETFSRVLHELAGEGHIAVSGRQITVLDGAALASLLS